MVNKTQYDEIELFTHACGNLSARDAVEDEESPNSRQDDTSSESSDSDHSLTYVEESFEVMFVPEKEIQQVLTRYEGINWRRLFSKVGGGG